MLKIFRRIPVYIKIYPGKIEIINIKTGQTISRSSLTKFSSNRLIIADFNAAEKLMRQIIRELGLSRNTLKVVIQQFDDFEDDLSESEKRILRDLGEQAGAVDVHIVNRKSKLTKEEMESFLKLN